MALDFGTLQVERLIIHEIPKRRSEDNAALRVTDKESPLEQTDKNSFSEKIRESLLRASYDVAFDPELDSPVPNLIFKILSNQSSGKDVFVSVSQQIARHLYGCQTGVNPPGVLVIAQLKLENKPSLAILKLEKEEGIQFEPEENEGLIVYNVKQLSNLMMTGGKVFKIGLFIKDSEEMATTLGYVSDKQSGTEVAKFFLNKFLGCYLLESSEIQTKKFYKSCQSFINDSVDSPELKAKYEIALLAEMNNNQTIVEPVKFARSNLQLNDQQNFINHLKQNGVPESAFQKNTNSIKNSIKSMHLSFDDNNISIALSGNPMAFKDVSIEPISDKKVKVQFEAELNKVGK